MRINALAQTESPLPEAPEEEGVWLDELTPRQIVAELDKYIVGQEEAKKSVAIVLRNRWRRQRVEDEMRDEIAPEQPDPDRAHRGGEDGDREASGPSRRCTLPEGRGLEVHRGRLRGPRRRVDDPRPGRGRRSTLVKRREARVRAFSELASARVHERNLDSADAGLPSRSRLPRPMALPSSSLARRGSSRRSRKMFRSVDGRHSREAAAICLRGW